MVGKTRPFWQILIVVGEHGGRIPLSCDECFVILEYMAEIAIEGVEEKYLLAAVRRHLDRCPDCRKHHLQRLDRLEEQLKTLNDLD